MNDFVTREISPPRQPRPLTGRMVLFALVAFFVVVASVNAVMMTIAIRTMPGLDVKSAYDASQTYNAEIARARAQELRGWKADVSLGKAGAERDIVIRLNDNAGAPVRGLVLNTRLAHPADRNADLVAVAKEIAPGVYAASFTQAHAGAWDLVLDGRAADREVYKSRSRIRL